MIGKFEIKKSRKKSTKAAIVYREGIAGVSKGVVDKTPRKD